MTRTITHRTKNKHRLWPLCPECKHAMRYICSNTYICRDCKMRATWNHNRKEWEFEKSKKLL